MFEAILYAVVFPLAMLYGIHNNFLKILRSEHSITSSSSIFKIDKPPVSAATIREAKKRLHRDLSEYPESACRMIAVSGLALAMNFIVALALFSKTDKLLSEAGAVFVKHHEELLSFSINTCSLIIAFYVIAFGFLSEKIKNKIYSELRELEDADEHLLNSIDHILTLLPFPHNTSFETYSKTVNSYKRKLTKAEIAIVRNIVENIIQREDQQAKCPPEIFIP